MPENRSPLSSGEAAAQDPFDGGGLYTHGENIVAQEWRSSWTRNCGTLAFVHTLWNMRFALRGSMNPPRAVVKTRPVSRQSAPAAIRSSRCRRRCALRMLTRGAGMVSAQGPGGDRASVTTRTPTVGECGSPHVDAGRRASLKMRLTGSRSTAVGASVWLLRRWPRQLGRIAWHLVDHGVDETAST